MSDSGAAEAPAVQPAADAIGADGADLPDTATLLLRPDAADKVAQAPGSGTLPAELEAWREARVRSRPDSADEADARLSPQTYPVNPATLPSPLSPGQPADPVAADVPRRPKRAPEPAPQSQDEDRGGQPGASGAHAKAFAGNAVDFVLSGMGQGPSRTDDREEPKAAPPSPVADAGAEPAPSFVAAAQRRTRWSSRPARAILWVGALLLVLALAAQVALSRRSSIAAHAPALAPVLTAMCQTLGCTVEPYRDIDAIVIVSDGFNRSGTASFRFTVTLRNQSDVPVATPALELVLSDALGQVVVRRVIDAAELNAPPMLTPRSEFAGISLLTVNDSKDADAITRYVVTAFYP